MPVFNSKGCGTHVGEDDPMKDIHVKFIPVHEMRYETVGDYWETEDSIEVRIAILPRASYMYAIMIHELVEKALNDRYGIPDCAVDAFDMGEGADLDEPGEDPRAPYHANHMKADSMEREFILYAGEDWIEYGDAIEALFPGGE